MTKSARTACLGCVALLVVAALLWVARGRVHLDWESLKLQLRTVDWRLVGLAVAAIYLSVALRAVRWRVLLGPTGETGVVRLMPSQFLGFTLVALVGRAADLARPYLVARRTKTPVATQLAVYSMERAFDLAAAGILFSGTLAFAPKDMPHHEAFARAGGLALVGTVLIAAFALAVRFAGGTVAAIVRKVFRMVSEGFAETSAAKVLEFREGMRSIRTLGQFGVALAWSLVTWGLIASSYLLTARSFRSTPELAGLTVSGMLLMATSMGGSLLQLPVVGWFTQIGVLAVALHEFFGAPVEAASACAAVLMLVTTLGIVPGGLIAARVEGVGLWDAARGGEAVAAR
jgi:uncharacterized membrane protein YbhN (UPF0104 family)